MFWHGRVCSHNQAADAMAAPAWNDATRRREVFDAAQRGDLVAVTAALNAGFPATAKDNWGNTLLRYAVYCNELRSLVPRMVAERWNPNAENCNGVTPVHFACGVGALESLQALVAAGGLLTSCDNSGWTPVFVAFRHACVLEWLATRPEIDWFHLEEDKRTALDIAKLNSVSSRCESILVGAMAAQRPRWYVRWRRWSPLRAAFVGAAVMTGRK
jgi:hypothetical protein